MIFQPTEITTTHSKTWNTDLVKFDETGKPYFSTQTKTIRLTNFDEFFIHMLSDHLPSARLNMHGDDLDRLCQFKEFYIDTLLEAQREYVKDSYSPP